MDTLNKRIKEVISPVPASELRYIDTMGEFIHFQRQRQERMRKKKEEEKIQEDTRRQNENSVNDKLQ